MIELEHWKEIIKHAADINVLCIDSEGKEKNNSLSCRAFFLLLSVIEHNKEIYNYGKPVRWHAETQKLKDFAWHDEDGWGWNNMAGLPFSVLTKPFYDEILKYMTEELKVKLPDGYKELLLLELDNGLFAMCTF